MSSYSSDDPASRAWRRKQMDISNDISGLPRDACVEAMVAALDALDLSDDDRITALTVYFQSLAQAQAEAAESVRANGDAMPLSSEMEGWLCRFQDGCIRMANDEDYRKTIAARLF